MSLPQDLRLKTTTTFFGHDFAIWAGLSWAVLLSCFGHSCDCSQLEACLGWTMAFTCLRVRSRWLKPLRVSRASLSGPSRRVGGSLHMIVPREQAPAHIMLADTTLVKVRHVAKSRICGEEGTAQGQDWEVGSLVVPAPVSHISCLGPARMCSSVCTHILAADP